MSERYIEIKGSWNRDHFEIHQTVTFPSCETSRRMSLILPNGMTIPSRATNKSLEMWPTPKRTTWSLHHSTKENTISLWNLCYKQYNCKLFDTPPTQYLLIYGFLLDSLDDGDFLKLKSPAFVIHQELIDASCGEMGNVCHWYGFRYWKVRCTNITTRLEGGEP